MVLLSLPQIIYKIEITINLLSHLIFQLKIIKINQLDLEVSSFDKKDKKLKSIIEKEKKKLINQTGSVEDSFLIAMATYDNPRQNIIG